jgi:hypothetical protein
MMLTVRHWVRQIKAALTGSIRHQPIRRRFNVEQMEDRIVPANFSAGDIAVLQLAAATNNTTGSILELNPTTANQASPVQTVGISATGNNALRFSDSGTSGYISRTNDGTLLTLPAYNTTDTTDSDLATVTAADPATDRAIGTLDNSANFTLQTTYTGASTNQIRSATSVDDVNYFIGDKGGLYTNGATTASFALNIGTTRSFGGSVYVLSTRTAAQGNNFNSAIGIASSPTATSFTGLSGVPIDASILDFYLIQSGSSGSTYDVLYTLDSGTSNNIKKFSLVGGTWTANGTASLASGALGLIAANSGSGGAFLYATTNKSPLADNALVRLTDTAGFNATININTANNVTLYTATGTNTLKGLDFAPSAANVPTVTSPTKTGIGISTATLGGTVTVTGGEAISQRGVVYSTSMANLTTGSPGSSPGVVAVPASGTSLGAFTVGVSGLQGTTTYYYAAYATSSAGTGYSSIDSFATQSANPPSIDTPTDTAITNNSATLGATVESDGGATISESGVYYALTSVNSNPQLNGTGVTKVDTASPVDSGAFTISATGLQPGKQYSFEAFASNSSGTTYTTATKFTTLAPPTITTPTATGITGSSANLGANVTSDGGSPVIKRGIVYALTSADSNPQLQDGTAGELDASGTTGVFSVPVTGLSGSTQYTFEAFATNTYGTTYTAATNFTTAAPGIITAWTFPALAGPPDNSPSPTFGTGTLSTLGMTNTYNGGNTASDDIISTSGTANTNFTENTLRVRGTSHNGWATFQNGAGAPEYTQGIELDSNTAGYSNIVFSFDWYSTTQGIRDLQVQYNTDTTNPNGWVNYQGPSPTGTFVTGGNDYYNANLSPVNPTIHIDLSKITAANNDSHLGIRLVSAFDSTGTLVNAQNQPNEYASAASTAGDIIPYNNSSGNWRFANLTFASGITTTTTITANPPAGQSPNQNVTFTATVTPAKGTQFPSGTVAFYDGSTQIGTTQNVTQVGTSNVGTANITISTLKPGVHGDITAQYTPAPGNGLIASGSSMNLVAGDPTDNPISYTINAPQATGVDISPVAGQAFTGVVATFSDGTFTSTTGFSALITWANGETTTGNIAFTGSKNETNINGQTVAVSLFTVTGTYTYASAGTYPISVTITDPNNNAATVNPTARVAYAPLSVLNVSNFNIAIGEPLSNVTVATFTDPGLVANLTALGISDPTTQFTASINWDDNSSPTTGTISYNSTTKIFSVAGSHTYTSVGSFSISVTVSPMTVSVERIDSSDPTNQNLVGDENGNTLTDSPSPDFIDQYVIGAANQTGALYTFSLPTVATAGGNEALTNSSYSVSEGEMTLSTNGQYLVTGGYNATVSAWAPQQTFSDASVINRVIGRIDGAGNIDTTTDLTDAYSGDNFRGVASTDGMQFWTSGHAGDSSDFVHYAQYGASTSTILTNGAANVNTVEIFNGQLYEGVRSGAAGIYQIGTGLPTTAGQSETLFIQVPQTNPLDITASDKPMSPFDFYLAKLNDGNPTDPSSGENVAYVADGEMGIARYDYSQTGGESSPQWNFSYYIGSTGSFKDNTYTVDGNGNITPTANFNSTNPIPTSNPNLDPNKAGGVKGLTGRIVNGQVQLFATTAFGTGSQPTPGESLIEVTDTGANSGFTKLATDIGASELTSVAFTPFQKVSETAHVMNAAPKGTDNTVSFTANTGYTFATGDFGFSDPNNSPANNLKAVEITTLPGTGALKDNGSAVHAKQFVSAADISNGLLRFTPTSGTGETSFTFQVQDDGGTTDGGVDTDPTPRTMNLDAIAATTSVGVTSSANPSVYGQPVTFTATVTNTTSSGATPTGSIQFMVDNVDFGSPVTLDGNAHASVVDAFLSGSSHSIKAVYGNTDGQFTPGPAATSTQTVQMVAREADPLNSSLTDLFVGGTSASTDIHLGLSRGQVIIQFGQHMNPVQTPLAGLNALVVYGQATNQHIEIDRQLTMAAFLYAGNGANAHIQAGGGPTVKIGGSGGNDFLEAGRGRAILIAGSGGGHLEGGSNNDILIGGTTKYDHNLSALMTILAEWNSDDSYPTRTSDLSSYLNSDTVHDNEVSDHLAGGTHLDWYFASLSGPHKDKMDTLRSGETVVGIH